MFMDASFDQTLIDRFDAPDVDALVLMGSYARGEAHQYSDIDLARFTSAHGDGRSKAFTGLIADRLVNVNDLGPAAVEEIFTKPDVASSYLAGLRFARPLRDHNDAFAHIQARAHAFTWDERMQQAANHWASEALAGWSEDMRKGLAGLVTNDIGQLLSARFASSWGLSHIMQVQRGVLMMSGHDFYDAVSNAVGNDSEWVHLRRVTFAISNANGAMPKLREEVVAGLKLYVETAQLLVKVLRSEDEPLIKQTTELIEEGLKTNQTLRSIRL
jgi:Nucleotidyltransferase domain